MGFTIKTTTHDNGHMEISMNERAVDTGMTKKLYKTNKFENKKKFTYLWQNILLNHNFSDIFGKS